MKFQIKRSEWLRGNVGVSTLFLSLEERSPSTPDRKRCCLGFFANACNISDAQLSGHQAPASYMASNPMDDPHEDWYTLFGPTRKGRSAWHHPLCQLLMLCNDSSIPTEGAREQRLMELFQDLGHEVTFVD